MLFNNVADLQMARIEFEFEATTDERRTEILKAVIQYMETHPNEFAMDILSCDSCHHKVFFAAYGKALCEGHIYSQAGIDEFYISNFCEFCFDALWDESNNTLNEALNNED